MPDDERAVPRLDDLPPVRQRIVRALIAARKARIAEDARYAAGEMTDDERAEYLARRRYIASVRPLSETRGRRRCGPSAARFSREDDHVDRPPAA